MFELVKNDIKKGVKLNKYVFLILAIIIFVTCIVLKVRISKAGIYFVIEESFLDYVLYIFKSVRHTDDSKGILNSVSVIWIAVQVIIGYIVLKHEKLDLTKNAKYSVLKFNRGAWWTSKCIWSGFAVVFCYAICYFTIFLFCFITGAKISMGCSEIIASNMYGEVSGYKINIYEFFMLFLLPIVISLAIIAIQRMIGFIINPIAGFVFVQGTLVLSMAPFFGNIAYQLKKNIYLDGVLNYSGAYCICVLSCTIGTIVGYFFFCNYDIAGK